MLIAVHDEVIVFALVVVLAYHFGFSYRHGALRIKALFAKIHYHTVTKLCDRFISRQLYRFTLVETGTIRQLRFHFWKSHFLIIFATSFAASETTGSHNRCDDYNCKDCSKPPYHPKCILLIISKHRLRYINSKIGIK